MCHSPALLQQQVWLYPVLVHSISCIVLAGPPAAGCDPDFTLVLLDCKGKRLAQLQVCQQQGIKTAFLTMIACLQSWEGGYVRDAGHRGGSQVCQQQGMRPRPSFWFGLHCAASWEEGGRVQAG